jgi:DNA-binding MarR family transcriptional regulator
VTSAADKRSRQVSPPFRLEAHVFYYFSQILARRTRALNTKLRPFGLDYPRWRVLAVLSEYADCSMQTLAEVSSVDRTTLTRTLTLMEGEGLVSRRRRETDRRGVELSLTPAGRETLEQILPISLAETDRALIGFSEVEIDGLRRQLQRIVENLKA